MATRGPKPKPAHLKILGGNPGKRPIEQSMELPAETPSAPACLDAEARREWSRICKALAPSRILTQADRAALASYCSSWSLFASATKTLAVEGIVSEGSMGQKVPHPLCRVLSDSVSQMVRLGDRLGLSPVSRKSLGVTPESEPSKREQFLNGADD